MIRVDEVSDGVFQVAFTGIDLRLINRAARRVHVSRDDALQALLMFVVGVYSKAMILERSQDELERQDEGLGRG